MQGLLHKAAADPLAGGATLEVKPEGIVVAIVSVTGVIDSVNDLIEPGAYAETLTKRRPKVVWSHSWTEPVGRVLHIEEWLPGDPRLPKLTKDGQPWPAAAGALVATMQFNLKNDQGLRAFQTVEFYTESKEAEYSIGYQVPAGASTKNTAGIRRIKKLDLFEVSPVLFGAAPLSMTLSLKSEIQDTEFADEDSVAALHEAAAAEIDWDEVTTAADGPTVEDVVPAGEVKTDTIELTAEDLAAGLDFLTPEARQRVESKQTGYDDGGELQPGATEMFHNDGSWISFDESADGTVVVRRVDGKAAAKPKDPKKKKPEDEEDEEPANDSFNSKHPRDGDGEFAPKDSGPTDKTPSDSDGDGLPDNWLDQVMKGDSRYAANAGKKGKAKAKSTAAAAKRKAEAAAKKKVRDAQRAKNASESSADAQARNAEMDRRDKVEDAFDAVREAEDNRRDTFKANLAKVKDPAKRKALQAGEAERRAKWNASWKAQRSKEMIRRRAWAKSQREKVAAKKKATAGEAAKSTKALTGVLGDHEYFPGADGMGCAECDDLVDVDAHLDGPGVKAAFGWAENLAWLDPPLGADEFEVKAEGGADRNRGNAEELRRWYVHGEGAAKIRWGTEGDFDRCRRIAAKHMTPTQAAGYCNLRHQDAVGSPPGKGHKDALLPGFETKLREWTPTAEVGELAAHLPAPERKNVSAPNIPGTLEERRERVACAVREALRGGQDEDGRFEWDAVDVVGTWDDRVVATRSNWQNGSDDVESYEMTYEITEDGVELGEPEQVELHVSIAPAARSDEDGPEEPGAMSPAPGLIDDAAYALKAHIAALETKEGRVLSRINLVRLQQAVTALLSVLKQAGVEIIEPSPKQVEDQRPGPEPVVTPDTTSELAREAKAYITQEELAAGLALLAL